MWTVEWNICTTAEPACHFRTEQVPPHSAVQHVCFLPDWARDEVEEVEGTRRYYRYNSETSGRIENEQHECRSQLPSTSTVDSSGLWWMNDRRRVIRPVMRHPTHGLSPRLQSQAGAQPMARVGGALDKAFAQRVSAK